MLIPTSSSHSRTIGLKWSLLTSYQTLLDAHDDLKAIEKDPNYIYSHEDLKEIKNRLAAIQLLLPEIKEAVK
jgi:hypothetical protein